MRLPARFARPAAIIWLATIIATLVGIAPGLAQQPLCRFPGPFKRVGVPVHHAAGGGPLSPLQIVADPSVVRLGPGKLRMWFTNADSRNRTGIAQADSADGIAFAPWRSQSARDPVMDLAMAPGEGDWDGPGAETAHVLRGPDGLWRMYYTGNRPPVGSVTYAIGLATSPDGERWTRRDRPVLEPLAAWERPICANAADPGTCRAGGVLEPSVLFDPAMGRYRMWYVGLGEPANSFRSFRIGHATSIDGVTWQRTGMPTFALGKRGAWDEMWTSHVNVVADPKAGFHMFYFGSATADYREGIEIQRGAIGHAYSPDGLTWTRNPANPILAPRDGGVDAWSVGGPTALIEDGKLRLWYFGSPTGGLASQVILAEAKCGP
jgi:hypothetical protein